MHIRVFDSEREAAAACARRIARAVEARPSLVLGLPTGRTPLNVYRELVELFTRDGPNWTQVRTFNLDEFLGVSTDDAGSFRAYMERHLFQHVNLSPAHIHFLDGAVEDAEAECARYEARLAEAGGLDLVLLGLGSNGHLAFNEPADGLRARCHRTRLSRQTREANLMLFGEDPSRVPMEALTLGMASIAQARQALLLAFGEAKAEAVRGMAEGPVSSRCPASFLQLHPDVEVWLDPAAARALS